MGFGGRNASMTQGVEVSCLVVCFALGVSGALLGAWIFSRASRAQLEAQRDAFELAREQAQRDLQQALLCVPQWIQQTVRMEIEFLGRQQAERHKAQFREQQRWQSGQDEQRLAEWRAMMPASTPRPVTAPVVASRPEERPTPAPARVSPGTTATRWCSNGGPRRPSRPQMYQVVMLNDDYTPMEFVVVVIQEFSTRTARRLPRSCSRSISMEKASAASIQGTSRPPRSSRSGGRPPGGPPPAVSE
jgi:hypothetical protein